MRNRYDLCALIVRQGSDFKEQLEQQDELAIVFGSVMTSGRRSAVRLYTEKNVLI